MSKKQMAHVYKPEAVEKANTLPHETYKAIKHANKIEMTYKLQQIFRAGYEKGFEDGKKAADENEH